MIENQAVRKGAETVSPGQTVEQPKNKTLPVRNKTSNPTHRFSINPQALKKIKLVAVAYSHVEREFFSTEEAYYAEKEVETRAAEVLRAIEKIGVTGRLYSADAHFLTDLLVDRPDLVLNLVDTLRGSDGLQTSIPGAL
ncbi:MAG: hypothetical protein Q7U74_13350, partial [Saprospiraceae bacterium]|nr:hypothetical protein [Saprospiraceae bacterium]